jgi:prepilin-type N-terminal cleavage/methylation domain-containing protein
LPFTQNDGCDDGRTQFAPTDIRASRNDGRTQFARTDIRASRGFSLVELSISLLILGILGFSLWKLIPAYNQVGETHPAEAQLARADEAIIGFIMREHRLPCPDTAGGGEENYDPASGCASTTGKLPERTLGLRLATPLNYGVYQNAGALGPLTRLSVAQTPWLPEPVTAATEWPLAGGVYVPGAHDVPSGINIGDLTILTPGPMTTMDYITPLLLRTSPTADEIDTVNTRVNGLDFCAKLRALQSDASPALLLTANNAIPVAYALAHPGATDANGDGDAFDGNTTTVFEAPHQAASDTYDDQVLAVGFNALSARLSCPAYLSRANAAGHTARAAYDNYLFMLAYLQYRTFALDGAYGDLQQAREGMTLGIVSIAGAVAAGIMAGAAAIMTADDGFTGVMAALGIAVTAAGLGEGIAELVLAVGAVDDAIEGVNDAANARIEAEAQARKILAVADATAVRALQLDAKGLRP